MEGDRQTANNQVELYFSQATPFLLLDIIDGYIVQKQSQMKIHQCCRVDAENIPGMHLFSGRRCEQEGKCARTMHEVLTVAGVHFYHAYCLCTIFYHRQHIRYH